MLTFKGTSSYPKRNSVIDRVKRGLWWLFLKIEEPRIIRIFHFLLYMALTVTGAGYLANPHDTYQGVLGDILATTLGCLVVLGGLLGAFAVLPGIWWVERLGVISLCTGLAIYLVVTLSIQASPFNIGLAWAVIVALIIRWLHIRKFQYAPGR